MAEIRQISAKFKNRLHKTSAWHDVCNTILHIIIKFLNWN